MSEPAVLDCDISLLVLVNSTVSGTGMVLDAFSPFGIAIGPGRIYHLAIPIVV